MTPIVYHILGKWIYVHTVTDQPMPGQAAVIGGSVGGVILIVFVVVAIVVMLRRRRSVDLCV